MQLHYSGLFLNKNRYKFEAIPDAKRCYTYLKTYYGFKCIVLE